MIVLVMQLNLPHAVCGMFLRLQVALVLAITSRNGANLCRACQPCSNVGMICSS